MYCNGTQSDDESKALDNMTIPHLRNGFLVHDPGLHAGWVEKRCYLMYTPPPQQESDGSFLIGAKENWLDAMEYYCEDLDWLLNLKQYRFWSQIVFEEDTMNMVLSFLQEGYPSYLIDEFPSDDDMWTMYQRIHKLIFKVMTRLSTHTESQVDYMTPKMLGELIYNNYIFTIPVLIDLCVMYGENRHLLMEIVNRVFEVQPEYHNDLTKSVGCFTQALLGVGVRLDVPLQSVTEVPTRLNSARNRLTLDSLTDLINHVLDTTVSLSSLLDIYAPACTAFHQQLFELRIVSFYENTIPELYQKLESLVNKDDSQEMYRRLKVKLERIRVELLKAFRDMLSSGVNDILVKKDNLSASEVKVIVDDYVNVLSEFLGDKRFVRDYHRRYPIDQDLDMLAQLCPEIDKLKSDFLLEAALTCYDVPAYKKKNTVKKKPSSSPVLPSPEEAEDESVRQKEKVCGVRLESLITQVKDILPHLGDGFVERCLEYYDYVSDAVVNAVLEGQLPPELQELDCSLPRIPPEEDVIEETDGLSVEQKEEDELDHIDHSKSHRGKRKGPYRDLRHMMKDKSHREEFRDFYSRLGVIETEDTVYDDEYDDTYDHLDVSVEDGGDLERRPFVVPRVLQPKDNSESSDGEAEAEEEEEENGPPRDQFVPNPEELRARAEQRRLARTSQKPKSKDVVGRPKGQGQEKQVTVNRSNKTAHKSVRGNHNRRMGAQRKRQQGMMT